MIYGRDACFRPIIHLDLVILGKLVKEGYAAEDISKAGVFVMEHIIHYMLLEGQIENWVIVVDIQKQGLSELPITAFGNVLKMFSGAYKSRAAKIFILNTTLLTYALWKAVSIFLEKGTRVKIVLTTDAVPPELNQSIHPAQLPEKLGGWLKEPEIAWPPAIPNRDFVLDEKCIVNEDIYKKLLAANPAMIPSPELSNEYISTRSTNEGKANRELFLKDKVVTLTYYNTVSSVKPYS